MLKFGWITRVASKAAIMFRLVEASRDVPSASGARTRAWRADCGGGAIEGCRGAFDVHDFAELPDFHAQVELEVLPNLEPHLVVRESSGGAAMRV